MIESGFTEISVTSSIDNSEEKSLLYYPEACENVPLLVGLHTWSADRYNQQSIMLPFCQTRNWALLLPEFRGPNLDSNPRSLEACASKLAMQDVIDAVESTVTDYSIDQSKIMLLGGSGGGHMALMLAGYRPEFWTAVSSWCPITDLARWHAQGRYVPHVEASCGGKPGDSPEVDKHYHDKSPINHAATIAKTILSVHHGRLDPSVHYSHTMDLIREVEKQNPKAFYFEIFDGAHELRYEQAFNWLESQISKTDQEDNQLTG